MGKCGKYGFHTLVIFSAFCLLELASLRQSSRHITAGWGQDHMRPRHRGAFPGGGTADCHGASRVARAADSKKVLKMPVSVESTLSSLG